MVWQSSITTGNLLSAGYNYQRAFFVCFIVLISTGTYTRRISVQGEVTTWPRPVNVYSGVQGFVATQFVREGDPVKRVILFIKLMSVKVHVEAWSMRLNDRISKTN